MAIDSSTREGFHLSPQQKNGWSLQQTQYRAFSVICVEGLLQVPVLESAVNTVVERHEILRTTFHLAPGIKTPFQVISPEPQFSWRSVDLTNQEERVAEYVAQEQEQPFDYFQGPLLRVTLIKQSDTRHLLLVSLPALCADSVTLANFINEVSRAYSASLDQDEPLQYADYAEWQLELLESADEHATAGKDYWAKVASSPVLPMQRRIVKPQEFVAASVAVDLELEKIEALAQQHETSVATVLFAAWQAFVWRLSGAVDSEFMLFNLSSGRKLEDMANAMGLYAKYLPVVGRCEDEPFVSHLRKAHNALSETSEWQEYFDPSTARDAVSFDFENRQTRYDAAELSFSVIDQRVCLSPFKLKLSCVRAGATLSSELYYDTHVFDQQTVKQFAGYVQHSFTEILQHPERRLSEIEMMDADELLRSLADLNQTALDLSLNKTVHELFEAQAARTPAAPALVSGDQELTYDELNTRANQLAHLLRRRGVGPDVRVGLCMERSVELIVGLLGILKAGGAYVPLNPDHPQERLEVQLRESQSSLLVTNDGVKLEFGGEIIDLKRDRAMLAAELNNNPQPIATADNLVYVIYTSGSTGVPKGVAVRHRNLVNYTLSILQLLEVDRPLAFATVSTISADLGNTCIFPSLVSGGCLHILSYEVAMEGDQLRDYFARRPIDVLKIVPSHLYGLLATQTDGGILPAKYLILGGEALSWNLVQQIAKLDHSCRILNHYGPTETTVGSLTFAVDASAVDYSATVPIGRPLANTRCYILDRWQRPVVPGVIGELYIGGAGVAAGYLNQAAETATRFVQDPIEDGARMYRTGDLARYLVDGNIEFLGRADHQVKVRGHRVELGEIEAVLSSQPGVRQATAIASRDESDDVRIVAYVVGASLSHDELRAALRKRLPEYMVPAAFVFLKSLPLTPNGKVDRAALPVPEDVRAGVQSQFIAPRTPVEEKVAGLWAALLKVKTVGVYDNFFELGGHSLLATQVVSRMRKEFQVEITLVSLFESPTVAAMAEKIEKATADNTARLLMELDQLSDDEASRLLGLEKT